MDGISSIRAVVYREGDTWIGQCIEYDICAQGDSLEQVRRRLLAAVKLERQHSLDRKGSPFAGIGPAPRRFSRMWVERASPFESFSEANNDRRGIGVHMKLAA